MAVDLTTFDKALKDHYSGVRVENMAMRKSAALAMIKKNADARGRKVPQPVIYSNPQGGSASLATAIANATSGGYEGFDLVRKSYYQVAHLGNEVLEASKNGADAFLNAKREIDAAVDNVAQALARQIYRSSGGAIGQISADTDVGTAVLKLEKPGDAFHFWKGMVLELSTTNGGGSVKSGTLTVAGVNRSTGEITCTGNISAGVATAAVGDYVFPEDCYDACIAGFDSWLPETAPGSGDNFFGVNRSVDSFLYGLHLDASSMSVSEALQRAASNALRSGATPDYVFMNHSKFADLAIAEGAKREYVAVDTKGKANLGFQGFQIVSGGRPITVVADVSCPEDKAYMLQLDTWTLWSAGKAPHILDRDGILMRNPNEDSYQVRVGSYAQLGCSAPGWNTSISF